MGIGNVKQRNKKKVYINKKGIKKKYNINIKDKSRND